MEGVPGQALELRQPNLGESPEAPVDVDGSAGELVPGMVDAFVAEVNQAATPAVDDRARPDRGFAASVRDNLDVDLTLALEDTENDRLAVGAAAAPTLAPTRRSFRRSPLCRTADAGPGKHARSLKARPVHGVAVQAARRLEGGRRRSSGRSRGFWPRKSANA